MSLGAVEFIRRFLLHVLPSGFVKVRQFGFLSNRNRKKMVRRCREVLPASSAEGIIMGRDRLLKRVEVAGTYWPLNHIELIIIDGAERRNRKRKQPRGFPLSCYVGLRMTPVASVRFAELNTRIKSIS